MGGSVWRGGGGGAAAPDSRVDEDDHEKSIGNMMISPKNASSHHFEISRIRTQVNIVRFWTVATVLIYLAKNYLHLR